MTTLADFIQQPHNLAQQLQATHLQTIVCPLNQFSTLHIAGDDASNFLQNLLSNDIRTVNTQQAQLSSLNTAKGRMLASLLVWQNQHDYLLQLPSTLADGIRKKLTMYVLRAKVKINLNDTLALGIAGPQAATLLARYYPELPEQTLSCSSHADVSIIKLDHNRYQLHTTSTQAADDLWQQLTQLATPVCHTCWDWLNIRAGIPIVLPATQEEFVPQMINFEILGGVNFKKGCYPGQEIVARMQYLGKAKKRMYLAHINSDSAPQAGDDLYSADLAGQSSGKIVNCAPAPQGGFDVLACVQIQSQATQNITWQSAQGPTLHFEALPYLIEQA